MTSGTFDGPGAVANSHDSAPQVPSLAAEAAAEPTVPEHRRDRIVILGRTQAGKTIYLATLYHALWSTPGQVTVRALNGRTHKACIEVIETLRKGQWPSSTTGSKYLDLEITYRGQPRPLVSLDYPGEVFRKAFIDGAETPDVEELLEHVDRAAAVLALVDPAIAEGADLTTAMDDDFGMLKAIERIRDWPGGDRVPVALVLTKIDKRQHLIRNAGGLTSFVRARYGPLVRSVPNLRVFGCSAVQEVRSGEGSQVRRDFTSQGVAAPLLYVLGQLDQQDADESQRQRLEQTREYIARMKRDEEEARRSSVVFWSVAWTTAVLLFAVVGLATWWLANR